MQNDNLKFKIIYAAAIGVISTIIFITAITIAADLYLPLKGWLKNVFSHHWVGKSVLAAVIFLLFAASGWLFSKRADDEKITKALILLNWFLVVGSLAILAFFIWEALIK